MGVPKYKPSKSRQRLRRTHDSLTPPAIIKCQNCGLATKSHVVCPSCGHYRARSGEGGKSRSVVQPGGES
jgi:large subunit ribosomal protein L32